MSEICPNYNNEKQRMGKTYMPERNILKVKVKEPEPNSEWKFKFYSRIPEDIAKVYSLCPKKSSKKEDGPEQIVTRVDAHLDKKGNLLNWINEECLFDIFRHDTFISSNVYTMIFSDELIQRFGIRENEYIDLTFKYISRQNGEELIEVYPDVTRNGKIEISPSFSDLPSKVVLPTVLIDYEFNDIFYKKLVNELNYAFGYGLFRAAMVLYRTLIENLLIDIFRESYAKSDMDLFYNKNHSRHHDLSVLIDNFNKKQADFKYQVNIDKNFYNQLRYYRETCNANAHKLEASMSHEEILEKRQEINNICALLARILNVNTKSNFKL